MSTKKEREQAEAVAVLKEWGVVGGTTIRAKVAQVSASGMSRRAYQSGSRGRWAGARWETVQEYQAA